MQIFVKNYFGKTITLDVEPDDTIENIKAKIQDKEGINPEVYILWGGRFSRNIYDDSKTLAYYGIHNESELHMVTKYKGNICYVIYNEIGDKLEITNLCFCCTSVNLLKEKIYEKLGIRPEFQELSLDRTIFTDNSANLASYGVSDKSKIKLIIKMNKNI